MLTETISGNFKNAFNCKKCPKTAYEDGCPMWWETLYTDKVNPGEQKMVRGCGYVLLPLFMTDVIRSAARPAAEISKMREEVVERVGTATALVLLSAKRSSNGYVEGHSNLSLGVDERGSS